MNTASELVLRIAGRYIEDDTNPKPPLLEWLQTECRVGCFQKALEACVKAQPEPLRPDLTLVEKIDPEKITLRIPGRVSDHENPSAFEMSAAFELNPVTLEIRRIDP